MYGEKIENEILKEYGINIKLDNYENMLINFKKMIMVDNFYNYKNDSNGRIISIKIDEKGIKREGKKFQSVKPIGSGSFNNAYIFNEGYNPWDSPSTIEKCINTEYIVKISKTGVYEIDSTIDANEEDFKSLFDAFYENIKHIVLYIIIKNKLNFKLIAKPFHFGIMKHMQFDDRSKIVSTTYIPIMFMEKGETTFDDYVEKLYQSKSKKIGNDVICNRNEKYNITTPNQLEIYKQNLVDLESKIIKYCNKLLIRIYNYLIKINELGIKFKHNDFKINNIVIINAREGASIFDNLGNLIQPVGNMLEPDNMYLGDTVIPLIIDFGYCEFEIIKSENYLNKINFVSNDDYKISPPLPLFWYSVLDIMMLHSSFSFIQICKPKGFGEDKELEYELSNFPIKNLFKFKNNPGSNILDASNLETFYFILSKLNNFKLDDLWKLFYKRQIFTERYIEGLKSRKVSFYIKPEELARNIGIPHFNLKEIKYENKYLKYKMKYLTLKNSKL